MMATGAPDILPRLVTLSAITVSLTVVMVALAAYWMTRFMLVTQLDNELLDVATVTAGPIAQDVEGMGALNADALRSANVTLMLLSSNGRAQQVPGVTVTLEPGDQVGQLPGHPGQFISGSSGAGGPAGRRLRRLRHSGQSVSRSGA